MRYYYYFLFRIYMFYKDTIKEKNGFSLTASMVATVLIGINLITINTLFYLIFNFWIDLNKTNTTIFSIVLWILNYFFLVRKEEFLKMNFTKDARGGGLVVLYIFISFLTAIICGIISHNKVLGI